MKKFKSGQTVLVTLASVKQKVVLSDGYRSNQKQVCIQPHGAKFEGQLSFAPFAYVTQRDLHEGAE